MPSCYDHKWPAEDDVCGILYYDGKEFREARYNKGKYGRLSLSHSDTYQFAYNPNGFINKTDKRTIHVDFWLLGVSDEEFSDGHVVFDARSGLWVWDEDSIYYYDYGFSINGESEDSDMFYDISYVDVSFSDISILKRVDPADFFSCRIDYMMEVIDTLGYTHNINGWAIYSNKRKQ
ncbi:MAG: hypothetical protein IKX20_08565 [Paludibacteraceae bacterium]|nr:hypothetical protein [Paludibacteraceae bacterium]